MRDYKLSIEYKHLKQHCPGGVYLLPSPHSLRTFHGVIFVRRGNFTNGIFKFVLECDPRYNDVGLHPKVTFSSYVYNPHVHPVTGELDLKVAYPEWDGSKHYLVTVMTYIKRIFYLKDYDTTADNGDDNAVNIESKYPNQEALSLCKNDPEGYRRRVSECVRESQRSVYLNEPGCTMQFKEEEACYEIFRGLMKRQFLSGENNDGGDVNTSLTSADTEDICRTVTCEDTLRTIQQARNQADGM